MIKIAWNMEKRTWIIIILFSAALSIQSSDAFDYCYRAVFNTSVAVSGTVATRRSEIESAVGDILTEFENDPALDFAISDSNTTLDRLDGDTSGSMFIVSICLTNSTKDQNEFTDILQTFNMTTQINSSTVDGNDFDECANNFTSCADVATCTNTNGSSTCTCPDIYADKSTNGTNGEICELPTNHTCLAGAVEVSAYNPYFSSRGISDTALTLGDCGGNLTGNIITFSGECSPMIEFNGTHNLYKWNLTNIEENPVLTVGTYVMIPITCIVEATSNVTLNFSGLPAEVIDSSRNVFSNALSERFEVEVNGFRDVGFVNSLVAGGTVATDQELSFQMGPRNGFITSNIKTVCRGLASSPAEGFGEPIQLITGGCVESNPSYSKLLNTVILIEQGVSSTASLSIGAHFFTNSQQTKLRFEIEICLDTGGSSACQPTCTSRRRRSLIHVLSKRQSDRQAISGVGSFVFSKDENDLCTRDCGIGACIYGPLRRQECLCPVDAYRDESGKCDEQGILHFSSIILIVGLVIASVALVAVAVALFAFFWMKKRNQKAEMTLPQS